MKNQVEDKQDIINMLDTWLNNPADLYAMTQKSWRYNNTEDKLQLPAIAEYRLISLSNYSEVIIDAQAEVTYLESKATDKIIIRFIAETAPYKPARFTRKFFRKIRNPFLFNPISIRNI